MAIYLKQTDGVYERLDRTDEQIIELISTNFYKKQAGVAISQYGVELGKGDPDTSENIAKIGSAFNIMYHGNRKNLNLYYENISSPLISLQTLPSSSSGNCLLNLSSITTKRYVNQKTNQHIILNQYTVNNANLGSNKYISTKLYGSYNELSLSTQFYMYNPDKNTSTSMASNEDTIIKYTPGYLNTSPYTRKHELDVINVYGNIKFPGNTETRSYTQGLLSPNNYGVAITDEAFIPTSNFQKASRISLGDNNGKWRYIYAINGTIQTSNELKKNILQTGIDSRYEALYEKLEPIAFTWNNETADCSNHDRVHLGLGAQTTKQHMNEVGISAQEYALYCEDTVETTDEETGEKTTTTEYGINYGQLHALHIHMIQKLLNKVDELETKILQLDIK